MHAQLNCAINVDLRKILVYYSGRGKPGRIGFAHFNDLRLDLDLINLGL